MTYVSVFTFHTILLTGLKDANAFIGRRVFLMADYAA